ncbi:hypothetical protein V6Z11_D05G374100 [Gossypium hirsutum]
MCDNKKGNVIGLDLSCNGLIGSLQSNSSLFSLQNLRWLNLSGNDLGISEIPSEFGKLRSLTYLNLSGVGFTGFIPPEISLFVRSKVHIVSVHTTDSWDEGTDCCKWKGVVCDNKKGNVIGLDLSCSGLIGSLQSNSSLFSLQNLRWLNLARNDFGNSEIPFEFGKLRSLTYLNLSDTGLTGLFPPKIFLLSELVNHDFNMLVHNLTKLETMVLDFMDLSLVVPYSFLNLTVSLKHLSLSYCYLQGNFPTQLFHLLYLQSMKLRYNPNLIETRFSKGLSDSISHLRHLKTLNLDSCVFMGSIPSALGNLTKITFLDVSGNIFMDFSSNNFSGVFPPSAFNLTSLTFMDFSSNFLQGTLPNNISGLSYLRELDLSANLLSGRVPGWLFSLPSLEYLNLSFNKLTGPIDPIQEPNLVQQVYLYKNEIQGTIPSSFFELINLTSLDLSSNNLSGNIKSCMLVKLRNLWSLDLSFNNLLSLTRCSNDVNSTLPMIIDFHFSSCNMQRFPSFLNASKQLKVLDLSNNQIHGSITKWKAEGWEGLDILNLSINFLTTVQQIPGKHLSILDLHSNSLQGLLPTPPQELYYFLISNYELDGEIPSKICNLSFLSVLDLSKNKLGGTIPDCLGTFSDQLSVVKLRTVNLNGNQLEGSIPQSLTSCQGLEVLDLGNNNINDTFPYWLGTLPHLQVLVPRSNRFHGDIQNFNGTFSFSSLRMIDLSRNEFTENFNFTVIDFSSNHFKGSIPDHLNHWISHQQLQGRIPVQLTDLTFLGALNLSHNNLEGQIPLANHFDTFSNDSFGGNPDYVDFHFADESETRLVWKIAAMGYGSGLVLGLSMGYIVFTTGRPHWLVKMIKRNPKKRRRIHRNGSRKN